MASVGSKYGVGVDTLDDEVEGLVGRLAGLGGIGLHTGGVLVGAGDVESLVGIVQGFQLGHVGVEVEGLEGLPIRQPWRRSSSRPSIRAVSSA